jgi:hypothetical protein
MKMTHTKNTQKNKSEATTRSVGVQHLVSWLSCNIAFFSFGKHWKGVYLHIFPRRCHRLYWANGKLKHGSHTKAKYWGAN